MRNPPRDKSLWRATIGGDPAKDRKEQDAMWDWNAADILLLCIAAYVAVIGFVRLMRGHRDKMVAELQVKWMEQQRLKVEQNFEERKRQESHRRAERQHQESEERSRRRANAA